MASDSTKTAGIFLILLVALGGGGTFAVNTLTSGTNQTDQTVTSQNQTVFNTHDPQNITEIPIYTNPNLNYQGDKSLPYTGTNLAPITEWGRYGSGPLEFGHYGNGNQISGVSTSISHDSNPSIYISGPHTSADVNTYEEVDGPYLAVNVGDHIYMSVWIKTESNTNNEGGRMGIDFYTTHGEPCWDGLPSSGQVGHNVFSGTPYSPSVASWTSTTGTCTGTNVMFVPWGSDWTLQTYDFVIPNKIYTAADVTDGELTIPAQVGFINPWIDIRTVGVTGTAWFSDIILYVAPSNGIVNTPTVSAPSLSSGSGSVVVGDPVVVNGAVDGSSGTPTNTITFYVSKNSGASWTTLQTRTLYSGAASSDPYYPTTAGTYMFKTFYSGDGTYTSGTSQPTYLTVTPPDIPIEPPAAQYFYVRMMTGTGGTTNPAAGVPIRYVFGDTATLTATASQGYHFSQWLVNGSVYGVANTIQIVGAVNWTYTCQPEFAANVVVPPISTTWAAVVTTEGSGTVSPAIGAHTITTLTQTFTATANSQYEFTGWLVDGATTYTTNPLTYTAAFGSTHTFKATFRYVGQTPGVSNPQASAIFDTMINQAEKLAVPSFDAILNQAEQRRV